MTPALWLVLAMLAFGWIARERDLLPESAPLVLNRLVLWLCLPALVLLKVHQWTPDASLLALAAIPWLIALVMMALVALAGRLFALDRATTGCLMLLTMLGNTAFLGYPLVDSLLGPAALADAVVYDQLGSFLILSLVAPLVVARYGHAERPAWPVLVKRVLSFPAFIAFVLALLPWPMPAALSEILSTLAGMLVPLAMLSVGLQLRLKPAREDLGPLALGLGLKMGVSAALGYALAVGFGLGSDTALTVMLQAAMPPMITAGILAADGGLAPRLASALVGWGLLLALLWLPLLVRAVG